MPLDGKLTAAQIKSYRKNGFIAIEGFLTPKELKTWQKATVDAVNDRLKKTRGWEGLNNQTKPDDFYPLKTLQTQRFDGTSFVLFGDPVTGTPDPQQT